MTKVSIFGQDEAPKPRRKPIEFVQVLALSGGTHDTTTTPVEWDNVRLMIKHCSNTFDVIHAWNDGMERGGCVYLGYWNDGFVEQ